MSHPNGTLEQLRTPRAVLGESPVWDDRSGKLLWVDVNGRKVFVYDDRTKETASYSVPFRPGCIALTEQSDFVVATEDRFLLFEELSAHSSTLAIIPDLPVANRLNDGAVDPRGRLWAGTMSPGGHETNGVLYRLGACRA